MSEQTASEELISRSRKEVIVTDQLGRSIKLRKPTPLQKLNLTSWVGAENAMNPAYMLTVQSYLHVCEINGEAVNIRTKLQLEALITRLGEEGEDAIAQAVVKNFMPKPQGGFEEVQSVIEMFFDPNSEDSFEAITNVLKEKFLSKFDKEREEVKKS